MYTNVYPRTSTVLRDCIYTIRVDGRDESVPYAYGMYAAIVYVQPMFIPRTRNIYPRTPTFTPRASTVGSRFIVPAYHGIYGVDILCFICFVFHLCYSICALMIFFFRSVAPTHVAPH